MVRPENYQRNERTKEPRRRSLSQGIIKRFIITLSSVADKLSTLGLESGFIAIRRWETCQQNTGWKPMLHCFQDC
jgi:hypothetical protein